MVLTATLLIMKTMLMISPRASDPSSSKMSSSKKLKKKTVIAPSGEIPLSPGLPGGLTFGLSWRLLADFVRTIVALCWTAICWRRRRRLIYASSKPSSANFSDKARSHAFEVLKNAVWCMSMMNREQEFSSLLLQLTSWINVRIKHHRIANML